MSDKPAFVIGIDPDVSKSGFSIYNRVTKNLELFDYDLFDLFNVLLQMKDLNILVRLEAGHLEKGVWHKGGNGAAKKVGANHEIGRQIEKFCKSNQIRYQLVKPCGFSSYDHNKFCSITGWDKKIRTNPEKRVAGLLVWGY